MSASARGVTAGVAGSAAVLVVAVLSLGFSHADADAKAAVPVVSGGKVQPVSITPASVRAVLKPTWLQRLLSRSDLIPLEPPRGRS